MKVLKIKSNICLPIPLDSISFLTPKWPIFTAGKEVCFSKIDLYSSGILVAASSMKSALSSELPKMTASFVNVKTATISLFVLFLAQYDET